ncbi:MAG: hypothetical protein QW622_01515 [Candidatus Pacearchaeota archaeon]
MKLNLKKAIPILTSALLVGSSFAAAAISSVDQWKSFGTDTAIVYGSEGMAEDSAAAGILGMALQAALSGATTTAVSGEAHLIEAPGNDLNYGEDLFDVEDTLEKRDLPTLLADGRYKETRGNTDNDVTYEQFLELQDNTGTIGFLKNTEASNKPVKTYLYFDDAVPAYNYRLVFDNPVEFDPANVDEDFELTKLKMLGREYFIVDATVDGANLVDSLTLMGGALKASQWEYSKQTYTLGNKTYEVEVKIISDTSESAILVINGEETDELVEGDTYVLEDDTRVGVLDVVPNEGAEKSTGTSEGNDLVTFYLGAEKIELSQGDEVEINGEPVDGSDVDLQTNAAAGELAEINLKMTPGDDIFLAKGESWTDPILGRFKFTNQGLLSKTEDFSLTTSGDDGVLEFKNIAGDTLEIPFVMDDVNDETFPGDEFIPNGIATITQDGNSGTAGNGNLLIADGDSCTGATAVTDCEGIKLLVVGTGGEARIIEVDDIDTTDNTVDLREVSPGSTLWKDRDYNNPIVLGFATITLTVGGNTITATDINTCGTTVCDAGDFLTSLAGEIDLEFDGTNANAYLFTDDGTNLMGGAVEAWTLEDDTAGAGGDMIIVPDSTGALTWDAEEKDSDYDVAIDAIDWGAIFRFNTDKEDELTWTYPEEEAIHKVYVSEELATIPELSGVAGTGAVLGDVIFADTELTSELKAKNLVIVGGSAINRAAAEALDLPYPTYGSSDAWQTATGVTGEGQAILKLLDNPYTAGKQALLVAGWSGSDTTKAAKALKESIPGIAGKASVRLDTSAATAVIAE